MGVGRAAALAIFRAATRVFFRQVEVIDAPDRATRGRLFCGNHVNGLIDPVLVMTSSAVVISPIAKSTLWKIPVLRTLLDLSEAVPVARKSDGVNAAAGAARNDDAFDAVAAHFERGGNVLIFPEGISHNEPSVQPLKTGGARMLLGAHARGVAGLTFQSVALEFDDRATFRSRALLIYGPVVELDAFLREPDHAALDAQGQARAITDRIAHDLAELVIEGVSWQERITIGRVSELIAADGGHATLSAWSDVGRRVEAARVQTRSLDRGEAHFSEVSGAVDRYFEALAEAGLVDAQVRAGEVPLTSRRLVTSLAWLLGWLASVPFAVIGACLYFVPYQLPRVAHRLAGKERDVVSTYKLLIGLVAMPVWWMALVGASFIVLPVPLSMAAAALATVAPIAALAWLDRFDARRGMRPWLLIRPGGVERLAALRKLRAHAMSTIDAARSFVEGGAAS